MSENGKTLEDTVKEEFDRRIFWRDRCCILALMDKDCFEKFVIGKKGKTEIIEVRQDNLFRNEDTILWKRKYGYSIELWKRAEKIAKGLDLEIILMPDSEEEFPMAFTDCERKIFLVYAPRILDDDENVHQFIKNFDKVKSC